MKNMIVIAVLFSLLAPVSFADKPEWAGKGKPTAEQKSAHKAEMNAKEGNIEREVFDSSKAEIQNQEKKQKQRSKKTKENSNQNSERREENSKKWWKFWSEE